MKKDSLSQKGIILSGFYLLKIEDQEKNLYTVYAKETRNDAF